MSSTNGKAGRPSDGKVRVADHRRRQLRLVARPGRRVLQERPGDRGCPGPDARQPRRLPHPRHRVRRRPSTSTPKRSARTCPRRSSAAEQHRASSATCRSRACKVEPRHDARRPRQVPLAGDREGARHDRRHRPDAEGHRRPTCVVNVPARRLRGRRPSGTSSRSSQAGVRVRQLHPGVHRARGVLARAGSRSAACRSSATTSSRRSARRSSTACSRACSTTAACKLERTYQLNVGGNTDFMQHAGARAARVEEDLQDERRHVAARTTTLAPDNVHIGPSDYVPWLTGPQVGVHPHGGPIVRRRAAEHRAEARGVGLAELGRRRDRRRALRQAGARPRHLAARSMARRRTS